MTLPSTLRCFCGVTECVGERTETRVEVTSGPGLLRVDRPCSPSQKGPEPQS